MDDLLDVFGILSDKTRLRILLLLRNNELCVCEIFAALNMSQPRVSRQLAILKNSKIIKDRRAGKWIYYKIEENDDTQYLMSILMLLPGWLDNDEVFNKDRESLKRISAIKNKDAGCKCLMNGREKLGE